MGMRGGIYNIRMRGGGEYNIGIGRGV